MKKVLPLLFAAALVFCPSASSNAQVLMFDFGGTAVSGTDRTISPYHTVSGFTDTSWNQVVAGGGVGGLLGSLVYSDGTAATGVGAYRGQGQPTSVDFQSSLGNNSSGGGTGILAGTSAARDSINGPSVAGTTAGFRVQGLTIGTYDIYVVGWLTTANDPRSFYAAATLPGNTNSVTTSRTWDTTGALTESATNNLTTDVAGWVEGANYVKFTVTTTALLPAISIGTGTGSGTRANINLVQIVAVPEPSSAMLMLGTGLGMLMAVRRRRISRA